MTKQAMTVIASGSIRATEKAELFELELFGPHQARSYMQTWLPKSLILKREEYDDGIVLTIPAWKARQLERSLPFGWVCAS